MLNSFAYFRCRAGCCCGIRPLIYGEKVDDKTHLIFCEFKRNFTTPLWHWSEKRKSSPQTVYSRLNQYIMFALKNILLLFKLNQITESGEKNPYWSSRDSRHCLWDEETGGIIPRKAGGIVFLRIFIFLGHSVYPVVNIIIPWYYYSSITVLTSLLEQTFSSIF